MRTCADYESATRTCADYESDTRTCADYESPTQALTHPQMQYQSSGFMTAPPGLGSMRHFFSVQSAASVSYSDTGGTFRLGVSTHTHDYAP